MNTIYTFHDFIMIKPNVEHAHVLKWDLRLENNAIKWF